MSNIVSRYDTLVIGAGTAGLTTACLLAKAGQNVHLVAKGMGALLLASGGVDVLGYHPANSRQPVTNPAAKIDDFLADHPDHPYNQAGKEKLNTGLESFLKLVNPALDYRGDINNNWLLPGGAGAVHPTCLAPESMIKGRLDTNDSMLVVGFNQLRDFYPALISQNLNAQNLGVQTGALNINVPIPVAKPMNATPLELARAFENFDFRRQVVAKIKGAAKKFDRVGFPAVLGVEGHPKVVADLEKQLGKPVFEISTLPPSVPGRRLFDQLKTTFLQAGGRMTVGPQIVDGAIENGRVTQIRMETANRLKAVAADNYVLATGGIFGGGIFAAADGTVTETIFGLPVAADNNRHAWFDKKFVSPQGQPVFNFGVTVNRQFNPVNGSSAPLAKNLYAAGAVLAGAEWTRSRTGDGVAITTAAAIAQQILRSHQ